MNKLNIYIHFMNLEKPYTDFIERMGLLVESHGLPRIAGRMLGLFMVTGASRTLDEMAELLNVSKASASTNARLLERLEILERHTLPNERRDYYRMAENPWEQFFEVARRRMKKMIDTLDNSLNQLPEEMDVAHRQLGRWREFYSFLSEDIDRSVLLWREHVARLDAG